MTTSKRRMMFGLSVTGMAAALLGSTARAQGDAKKLPALVGTWRVTFDRPPDRRERPTSRSHRTAPPCERPAGDDNRFSGTAKGTTHGFDGTLRGTVAGAFQGTRVVVEPYVE